MTLASRLPLAGGQLTVEQLTKQTGMTTKRNYGRFAFWTVIALLATITLAATVQMRQWVAAPYVTLPAPAAFKARVEQQPCGQGRAFVYPARVRAAYGLK